MTEVVQGAFQQANIDFVKGPPSATGIHQANDRNSAFRDTKAGMAKVTRCGTDCTNPTLDANVRKAIYERKQQFPLTVILSANVSKTVAAIETPTYVQKNVCVQARKHVVRLLDFIKLCLW